MIGINLLPDVKKEFLQAQQTRNAVISLSIVTMLAVGGAMAFLALFIYVGQTTMIAMAKTDVESKQKTFSEEPEIGKYLTIQQQLDSLHTLHDSTHKIMYSRLLAYLPQLNPAAPDNIQLGLVKVQASDSTISLQGMAADFKGMDTFKNTLEQATIAYKLDGQEKEENLFSSVTIRSATLTRNNNTAGVSFEFILVYAKEAFSPDATDIRLNVPKLTISDSKTNAPKDLFTDKGKAN